MAKAADSFNSYSGIGFQTTLTPAFEDLKAEQASFSTRIQELVKLFNDLKDKPVDADDLDLTTTLQAFTESREDFMDSLRRWYARSGEAIVNHIDANSKRRVKRVHDFLEGVKRKLRTTTPLGLGEEEGEDNAAWLESKETQFPETVIPAGALDMKQDLKHRLRGAGAALWEGMTNSPKKPLPVKTSTPDSDSKVARGKKRKEAEDEEAQREKGGVPKARKTARESKSRKDDKGEEVITPLNKREGEDDDEQGQGNDQKKEESQFPTQIFEPAILFEKKGDKKEEEGGKKEVMVGDEFADEVKAAQERLERIRREADEEEEKAREEEKEMEKRRREEKEEEKKRIEKE